MTVGHHADLEGKGSVIAIVRALLKHVLTLDETTSALAACTEWLLIEAIGRLMRRRTAFFIAHRLYAILSANNIVALYVGGIVAMDTQEELLALDGFYKEAHSQSSNINKK